MNLYLSMYSKLLSTMSNIQFISSKNNILFILNMNKILFPNKKVCEPEFLIPFFSYEFSLFY